MENGLEASTWSEKVAFTPSGSSSMREKFGRFIGKQLIQGRNKFYEQEGAEIFQDFEHTKNVAGCVR